MNGIKKFFSRFSKMQIIIGCIIIVIFSGAMGILFGTPEVKSITIGDINIDKGSTAETEISIEPEKADIKSVKCSIDNEDVATLNGNTVTGVEEGKAELKCKSGSVEKTSSIVVKLTEEQKKDKDENVDALLKQSRNSMTDAEKITIRDYIKKSLENVLKSPSTADYPDSTFDQLKDWDMIKKDNLVTISSYVDSENGFGAMVRSTIVAQVKMDDEGNGEISYLELDGTVYLGTKI